MRFATATCMAMLLVSTVAVIAAPPAPRPVRALKRKPVYGNKAQSGTERIRRAQVDTKLLRRYKSKATKEDLPYLMQRRQNRASPTVGSCQYEGPQPDTSQYANSDTSDGCTTDYFEVDPTYLQLADGYTLTENGHVNFQYIPIGQYHGSGSYRDPDPNWTILSGGLQFDPNNNAAGAEWIGRDYFDWSAGADLPAEGYCIVWVQVDDFNPHFGEGGQGPVCYCPTLSRRRRY